jgi:hypothetical protein
LITRYRDGKEISYNIAAAVSAVVVTNYDDGDGGRRKEREKGSERI